MIWVVFGTLFTLTGCSWGPPEISPRGVRSLVVNLIADKVSDMQSKQEKKGRVPKLKEPLVDWGPIRIRSDGRLRYRKSKPDEERRVSTPENDRFSSSLSLRLSTDQAYVEWKFRF